MSTRANNDFMGFAVRPSLKPQARVRDSGLPIDQERMQRALSGPSRMIPNGLTPEQVLEFILGSDAVKGR